MNGLNSIRNVRYCNSNFTIWFSFHEMKIRLLKKTEGPAGDFKVDMEMGKVIPY